MLFAAANFVLVFVLAACLFALAKGGPAERSGAVVILANLLAGVVHQAFLHDQILALCIDGLTALALLGVTVRYASFWLGGVMLLYAMQFALHAYYFVLERPRDTLHVVANDLIFFAVGMCVAAGTLLTWRRRRATAAA